MSAPISAAGVAATVAAAAAVAAAILVSQSEAGKAVQEDLHRALSPPTLADKADSAAAAVGNLFSSTGDAIEDAAHAAASSAKATVHQATGPPSMHLSSLFSDSPLAGVTAEELGFPAPGAVARAKTTTTPHPF